MDTTNYPLTASQRLNNAVARPSTRHSLLTCWRWGDDVGETCDHCQKPPRDDTATETNSCPQQAVNVIFLVLRSLPARAFSIFSSHLVSVLSDRLFSANRFGSFLQCLCNPSRQWSWGHSTLPNLSVFTSRRLSHPLVWHLLLLSTHVSFPCLCLSPPLETPDWSLWCSFEGCPLRLWHPIPYLPLTLPAASLFCVQRGNGNLRYKVL